MANKTFEVREGFLGTTLNVNTITVPITVGVPSIIATVNSTGFFYSSLGIGSLVANATGVYHTGTVNCTSVTANTLALTNSFSIASTTVANTLGIYFTQYNATTNTTGIFVTNSSSLYHSHNGQVASLGVGVAATGVNGEIVATGTITESYSDERLKEIIEIIPNPIESVKSLNGFIYRNNDLAKSFGYTSEEEQVGLSAQEVEKILPQIVKLAPFDMVVEEGVIYSKSGENYKTIQYERLIPLLVEAIKAQQIQIDYLMKKVKDD